MKKEYWHEIQKLLSDTLGCGDIVSLSRWNDSNSIEADIQLSSNLLCNTVHEVKDDVELIHYTTITSLFEIINSKKLRLGNAGQMNDPQELSYFLRTLNNEAITEFKEQQKNIFIASFCEYKSSRNNKGEQLSMWRNYGDNGNGVGIVFKLANKKIQNNWIDCALGKVDYSSENKSFENIKEYFSLVEKYKNEKKFSINNIPKIIYLLAAFNKAEIWSEEREIRLLRYVKWNKLEWAYKFNSRDFVSDVKATHQNGQIKYFIELDLDNNSRLGLAKKNSETINAREKDNKISETHIFDFYPALEIKKIIFGYQIAESFKNTLFNAIRKLAYQNFGISIGAEDSIYTEYFKKEEKAE